MIDEDLPLVLTRNFTTEPAGFDRHLVRASLSSDVAAAVDGSALTLLSCFVTPTSPRAARLKLGAGAIADAVVTRTLEALLAHHLLRPAGSPGTSIAASGYATAAAHHPMLLDAPRMEAYRTAIERHARGKRVVEIGCGTGLLSIFAAKAGATSVVGIEESGIAEIARLLVEENGVADRVQIVSANSLDVTVDQRAEVLIHELIGHEPYAERALRYLDDARERLVTEDAVWIPSAIEVRCRAVQRRADPDRAARLDAETDDLERRYDVRLGAYREALHALPSVPRFEMRLSLGDDDARTDDAVLSAVDFTAARVGAPTIAATLEVEHGGVLDALVVSFRARMDHDLWLTNAPEDRLTHWGLAIYELPEPRTVAVGDPLRVSGALTTIDGMERMELRVE